MKIAVSSTGASLNSQIEPRFGRCEQFIIVDPETMRFEVMENPGSIASGGAGITTAQEIARKGAEAVITGHCGPNAHRVLTTAGIDVITGVSGTVQEVVTGYIRGQYTPSVNPNAPEHFGAGAGFKRGKGKGSNL